MGRCGSHLPRSLWGEGGRGSGCLTLAGLPGESSSAIRERESCETASVLAGLTLILPWALQVREAQKQDRHTERRPAGRAQPPWGPAPSGGAVPLGLCGSSHAGLVLLSAERGDDLGERMPSPKVRTGALSWEPCVFLLWLLLGFHLVPVNVCTLSGSPTCWPQGPCTGPAGSGACVVPSVSAARPPHAVRADAPCAHRVVPAVFPLSWRA